MGTSTGIKTALISVSDKRGVAEFARGLEALGVAYDVATFDGGHRLDDTTLQALAEHDRSPHT